MSRRPVSQRGSCAILLIALHTVPSAPVDDPPPSFGALLNELRSGEPIDTEALVAAAESSAREGRPDAPRIAAFYTGLSTDELRRGFEAHARYRVLHDRISAAEDANLAGAEWVEERRSIEAELNQLIESEGTAADLLPVGLALGSLASIEVERAVAAGPESEERLLWLASAEEYAREALERFDRIGAWQPQLQPLLVRGRIQRARLAYADAEETLESCARRAVQVGRDDFALLALEELLAVANDHDDVFLRERLLRRVAELAPPEGFRPLIETTAEHLIDERQPGAALALLQQNPPPADADTETRERHALLEGNALLRLGRIREAGESYARVTANPVVRSLAEARFALADDRPAAAIEALADKNELEFDELARAIADTTRGEAELARGQAGRAVLHLERALAAADEVDERRVRELVDQDSTRTTIGEWLGLHTIALLAAARIELGESLEALRVIEESQARSLREGRASERRFRRLAGDHVPPLGATNQGLLEWSRRYELGLVSWVLGADFGIVVWLAPDGTAHAERISIKKSAIDRARRRFVEALTNGREEHADRIAGEIAEALWPRALRDHLATLPESDVAPRLLCLTHGELARVPLERLRLGNGRLVDEVATIVTLPGLPDAEPGPREPLPTRWIVAGAPIASPGSELPGARRELEAALATIPDTTGLIGQQFHQESLERELRAGGNLHIATHLARSEDCAPRRFAPEGLVLSDGAVLCAEQIADLAPTLHTALLSACESAGGRPVDAEGLRGVARAFLESGTRNLVLTLWPVSDSAAESFAAAFHRALADGQDPDRATRRARRALREQGRPSSDWSAFRFVGRD